METVSVLNSLSSPQSYKAAFTVDIWMRFLRFKCPQTYEHCVRVALLAGEFARHVGLSELDTSRLMRGCFLHDLGKIMIPQHILHQKEKLTEEQWSLMKLHPILGAELLEERLVRDKAIISLVQHHHERWDGRGYPAGLAGETIPYFARICAVLDAFDCMLSERPYQQAKTIEQAKEELRKHSGTQFDSIIVEQFLRLPHKTFQGYARRGRE